MGGTVLLVEDEHVPGEVAFRTDKGTQRGLNRWLQHLDGEGVAATDSMDGGGSVKPLLEGRGFGLFDISNAGAHLRQRMIVGSGSG